VSRRRYSPACWGPGWCYGGSCPDCQAARSLKSEWRALAHELASDEEGEVYEPDDEPPEPYEPTDYEVDREVDRYHASLDPEA